MVRVIEAIEAAGIENILIVTGHEADRVAAATARRGRIITYNPGHAKGMGTSVAVGIAALDDAVAGALVAQGDMPALDPALIADLCHRFEDAGYDRVVYPVLPDGRQGNPVIWPRRQFTQLRTLDGDRGGKHLIESEGERAIRVAVAGPAAAADIDTPQELSAYLASRSSQPE